MLEDALILFIAWSNAINSVVSLLFGLLIFISNRRSDVARWYSYFCFFVALWSGHYAFWLFNADDYFLILNHMRLLNLSAAFIPYVWSEFTFRFLDKPHRALTILNTCILLVIAPFSVTGLFVPYAEPRLFFPFWPVPGPVFHLYAVWFLLMILYALYSLRRGYLDATGIRREQIRYVYIGSGLALLAGSFNFFLCYHIPVPPILNFLITVYVFLAAYAIKQYRLLGVRFTSQDKERLRTLLGATGSIHHEVRNPINFILSDAGALEERLETATKQELRDLVRNIRTHAVRIADVTRAMSRYARPVKDLAVMEPVSLGEVIRTCVGDLQGSLEDLRGIAIDIDVPGDLPSVRGDRAFLTESLRNFLENSARAIRIAGREEGRIRVRAFLRDKRRIALEVEDNGCGIEEKDLDRVFELGYSTRRGDHLKHGAGLFLVKWYADQMKAELKIESEAGRGTKVSMILPAVRGSSR